MMFKIAYTHGAEFHADDVFSAAMLRILNEAIVIRRVLSVPSSIEEDAIVFDIGNGKYDHHSMDRELRESGIPYAAFGLLWRDFGEAVCEKIGCGEYAKSVAEMVDGQLVEGIDANDNGVRNTAGKYAEQTASGIIRDFNPTWLEDTTHDEAFEDAVAVADGILRRSIKKSCAVIRAKKIVQLAVREQKDQRFVVLDKFIPWQGTLLREDRKKECLYVIFPSSRGGYCAQAVPVKAGSMEQRKPFPKEWRGLNGKDLAEKTGFRDATFCHATGFLVAADSLDTTIGLVNQAIDAPAS